MFVFLINIFAFITNKQIIERFVHAAIDYKQNNIFNLGVHLSQNKPNFYTDTIFSIDDYIDNISCFRIPSVISTNQSHIIFSEARIHSCADCSLTGIVMKEYLFNSNTFTKLKWVVPPYNRSGNFVPLYDSINNKITAHYASGGHKSTYNKWDCAPATYNFEIVSHDLGKTWSEPTIIKNLGKYYGLQPGPGNSAVTIQHNKTHIDYYFAAHYLTAYREHGGVVIYKSNDNGFTYKPIKFYPKMDEPSITIINNTYLYLNMRTNYGFRGVAWSNDSGLTWSESFLDQTLIDPNCEGGLSAYKDYLLFANPVMKYSRANLTLFFKHYKASGWNTIQIADPSILTDYSVIVQNPIIINHTKYIGVIWGSCRIPFPFRPWCMYGWEIKISYIPLYKINICN